MARSLGLILLGFVIYHLDGQVKSWQELKHLGLHGFVAQAFKRELFQTLVHIAADLAVRPSRYCGRNVYQGGLPHRLGRSAPGAFTLVLLPFCLGLPVIDGGPLGFLTWSIPLLVGSLAYDVAAGRQPGRGSSKSDSKASGGVNRAHGDGLLAICLGGSHAAPPFVEPAEGTSVNLWTMSQRTGSVSYQTFGAGFSLAVYALFVLLCDQGRLRVGLFRTFGQNPLAAYIVHPMVAEAIKPYTPRDSPFWYVAAGFLLYFAICYLLIRYLERNDIFLRL